MQFAFLIILIGALGAGILVLASMGFRQWRRRKALARAAHEMGMMFSAKDPFDLTVGGSQPAGGERHLRPIQRVVLAGVRLSV